MCNKDDQGHLLSRKCITYKDIKARSLISLKAFSAQVLLESLRQPDHVVIHRNPLDELITG